MERVKVLGIKYIVAIIVTFAIYGTFNHVSLGRLLLISTLVIIIPYLGDLFLLPKIGNLYATISDFGLYFLLYWGLTSTFIGVSPPIVLTSLAAAFLLQLLNLYCMFIYWKMYSILTKKAELLFINSKLNLLKNQMFILLKKMII